MRFFFDRFNAPLKFTAQFQPFLIFRSERAFVFQRSIDLWNWELVFVWPKYLAGHISHRISLSLWEGISHFLFFFLGGAINSFMAPIPMHGHSNIFFTK